MVRHVDICSRETFSAFAKSGNVATLPQACEAIRELAGKPVLVYEMAADKKDTVTMSEQNLLEAWFALDATVIREAADSSLLKPAVMVQTAAGVGQPKSLSISNRFLMPVTSFFRSVADAVNCGEPDKVHGAEQIKWAKQGDACPHRRGYGKHAIV